MLPKNTPKYLIPLFVHLRPSGESFLSLPEPHHKPIDLSNLTFALDELAYYSKVSLTISKPSSLVHIMQRSSAYADVMNECPNTFKP